MVGLNPNQVESNLKNEFLETEISFNFFQKFKKKIYKNRAKQKTLTLPKKIDLKKN